MNMHIPGFTAEASVYRVSRDYLGTGVAGSQDGAVIPAIPRCENCEDLLDYCAEHDWRPRAACNACASGHCSRGVEKPPGLVDPFRHNRFIEGL
jgi:hypothetical protein